jgi:uncharacterized protein YbgA (DUF1722 family)
MEHAGYSVMAQAGIVAMQSDKTTLLAHCRKCRKRLNVCMHITGQDWFILALATREAATTSSGFTASVDPAPRL